MSTRYDRHRPRTGRSRSAGDLARRRQSKAEQRTELIRHAVLSIGPDVNHEDVARMSGVPLGYLLWAYPSAEDLVRAGESPAPTERQVAGRHSR